MNDAALNFIKEMNDAGLEFKPKSCMMSGVCCTKAPCAYGEWNEDKSACAHLQPPNGVGQRACGKYDWIKQNVADWEFYPAFGAGCCMPIGNTKRLEIIKNLNNKADENNQTI